MAFDVPPLFGQLPGERIVSDVEGISGADGKGLVPVSEPLLGGREAEYLASCVKDGRLSAGAFVERFETGWAAACGRRHGVAVSSGTTALEAALDALDLSPGDEIVMPAFTIVSCALAALRVGAVPVLVDSDPSTWCMDAGAALSRITARTRAILAVHVYGHPADLDALRAVADRHGLALVEDAAEAHASEVLIGRAGPSPEWRRCGAVGDLSTFSFYANKLVSTGEGGMVLTDDDALAARLRAYRNLCHAPARRFLHERLGESVRMSELQGAVGVAQLENLDERIARKGRIRKRYDEELAPVSALERQSEAPWARSVLWMYGIVAREESGLDAEVLARRLLARGIETRPFFLGLHEQPALRARGLFAGERHPVAERLARRGLYLPSGLTLSERDLARVSAAVRASLESAA